MGFPMGYSELFLPKILLHVVTILGHVRGLFLWAFGSLGLQDLVEHDPAWSPPGPRLEFCSASAMLIRESLPVVRVEELLQGSAGGAEVCAVCLSELEPGAEVRLLSNCRHIFHRGCLDRWIRHEQWTCPLCRMPLVPEELQGALNEGVWAAGIPDSYFSPSENSISPG